MAASLTTADRRSFAALKTIEKGYQECVKAMEHLQTCEVLLQKTLEDALRSSQERETAIDAILKTQSYPQPKLVQQLNSQNAKAFFLESATKECNEIFNAGWQRIEELRHKLLVVRQQNSLLLIQNQLDDRIQTIMLGTPFQLQKMTSRLALIAKDLEHFPASVLADKEEAQVEWQTHFAAVIATQQTLGNQDQPATAIRKFLEELDQFSINPPHDSVIFNQELLEAILARYRDQYKKLKKTCLELWNKSLRLRIEVEFKFALIECSKALNTSLPHLKDQFCKLQQDLKKLRHQFKGKNAPKEEEGWKNDHKHLSVHFEKLKTDFSTLLLIWKNARIECGSRLKELESKADSVKEIAAQAIESEDFKRSLLEDVLKWVLLFQNSPQAIEAHLKEIAVWMDITDAVLTERWSDFPKLKLFEINRTPGYDYSKYCVYRNQIKGLITEK